MLTKFSINRCFKPRNFENIQSSQLHHFADASQDGYGAVSYLRQVNDTGAIHCSLVMSKSRVAPLKKITISRMELTAATVAVRINHMIHQTLDVPIDETFFWTDSTSKLDYINNESARFHTFVANRLAVIHDGSSVSQWRYVPTAENPADDCSRGLTVQKFLQNQRWIQGPDFLYPTEDQWPTLAKDSSTSLEDDPEVKTVKVNAAAVSKPDDPIIRLLTYHSSWYKLKRSVAWILKFKNQLIQKAQKMAATDTAEDSNQRSSDSKTLNSVDMAASEKAIICYIQRSSFSEEITDLMKRNGVKNSSHISRLNPTLKDGLLRVGGRLRCADMPEDAKTPIIMTT